MQLPPTRETLRGWVGGLRQRRGLCSGADRPRMHSARRDGPNEFDVVSLPGRATGRLSRGTMATCSYGHSEVLAS